MVQEFLMSISRRLTVRGLSWRLDRFKGATPRYRPVADRLLYVPASCLPYHISGYTTRTHAVIRAMRQSGADVRVLTRPGYPWDRVDRVAQPAGDRSRVDEIEYRHTRWPRNNIPVLAYALLAARPIVVAAIEQKVAAIHAASNHVNALPALLAARQLGLPFQYEMRGLWELTRISRMPDYEGSEAFRQGLQLESLVARQADRLFVISDQLGRFVCDHWGVDAARMALLPNCVDADRFQAAEPLAVEANTIGYAGSLMGYEGLDTLIDAVGALVRSGHPVTVQLIGDGEARAGLEAQVARLGLADRVRFLGKVQPDAARTLLEACALVCIPRKPFKVCQIVPPIKLVEALAMGKPVIVPDLPVFRDEMGDEPAGWFFKSGDADDLARVIAVATGNRDMLAALSARARKYAATKRNWRDFVIEALPTAQGEA